MAEVKRYRFGGDDWSYPDRIEDPKGEYILASDFDAYRREVEALLKVYREYYDARHSYFDKYGMQEAYGTKAWERVEKAEAAIAAVRARGKT